MIRLHAIAAVLLFALAPHASAATFSDTNSLESNIAIEELAKRNIIQGYEDGTFRPLLSINRAEFLTMLINTLYPLSRKPRDLRCFTDLEQKTPQWYARVVCIAKELGIVQGYPDDTFRPEQPVIVAEALKMSFLSFGVLPTHTSSVWYEPYLVLARDRSLLVSKLKNPGAPLSRAETATILYSLLREREDNDRHQTTTTSVCGDGKKEALEQCDDGNTEDSDGCSSICILVPEPVRMSFLHITTEANGTVTNSARGQKNVPLLRFSATANRQDALLTSLAFVPTIGSLLYATNYTLSMDRNGDGLYEETTQLHGRAERDRLIFDQVEGGGVVIPKDLRVPFLITADLVSTLGPVGLQLDFGTTILGYIEAQGAVDGLSLPGIETNNVCNASDCFIRVNTRESTNITIVNRGSLFVTADSTPTRNHILLGGTTTDTLLRLSLRAEGEAIDLKKIAFDGIPSSVDSLLLTNLTNGVSSEPFAQATNGQCAAEPSTRLCAVLPYSTLVIPANTSVTIAVAARMKNDQTGAVSGEMTSISLSAANGTTHAIEARGVSSQSELEQNNGDGILQGEIIIGQVTPVANASITAPANDVALATISSITRSGIAEENIIPSGNATIAKFTFVASHHTNSYLGSNDVILRTLRFHVSAQNVQLDPAGYRLSADENPSSVLPCSASATTGSFDVTCSTIDAGLIRSRINEGMSATYRLTGNITNTALGNGSSSFSVDLGILGQRGVINSVEWSDGVMTFTWVDIPETSVSGTVYRTR